MVRRAISALRRHGVLGAGMRLVWRVRPPAAKCTGLCADVLRDRAGIEIGGPSQIFSRHGVLPIYPVVAHLDNCNFGRSTVWEGTIAEGQTFQFDPERRPGHQFIAEATDLKGIPPESYDFVLASHTLEHTANPIRALREWQRVLKPGGVLVLVVPHKDGTFDHRRPVTTLAHLVDDWTRGTGEDDLTHLPEILALHDLSRDLAAGDEAAFDARSRNNAENRCLHHHVFDTALAVAVVDHVGLQILAAEALWPFHIIVIGRRLQQDQRTQNDSYLEDAAEHNRLSPFATDRDRRSGSVAREGFPSRAPVHSLRARTAGQPEEPVVYDTDCRPVRGLPLSHRI